jgi:hypothetical protein
MTNTNTCEFTINDVRLSIAQKASKRFINMVLKVKKIRNHDELDNICVFTKKVFELKKRTTKVVNR